MNLENVRLSERSQSQRAALYDSIYMSYLEQANPDTGSKLLVARARGAGKNRDRLLMCTGFAWVWMKFWNYTEIYNIVDMLNTTELYIHLKMVNFN